MLSPSACPAVCHTPSIIFLLCRAVVHIALHNGFCKGTKRERERERRKEGEERSERETERKREEEKS
jgi:hypothetical protein